MVQPTRIYQLLPMPNKENHLLADLFITANAQKLHITLAWGLEDFPIALRGAKTKQNRDIFFPATMATKRNRYKEVSYLTTKTMDTEDDRQWSHSVKHNH